MRVLRWSADEARAAVASADLDRRVGAAWGVAAVAVDVGLDPGEDLAAALTTHPVVAVGVGSTAGPTWDAVALDPDPLLAGAAAAPQAAVTAAQLLRHPVGDSHSGLVRESLAYAMLQSGPEFAAWLTTQGRRTRTDDAHRISTSREDDLTVVALDRPRLRNLVDARIRDELVDVLRALVAADRGAVRLVGRGPAFCAGGDPAEFGTVADPATGHLIRASANVAPWLLALSTRLEAHVHGPCVGAGVEMAAFASRIVADPGARFRLPETGMGLVPGAGGTVSVPARIGRQRTLEWLLTDRELDADTALDWGLVDEIAEVSRTG